MLIVKQYAQLEADCQARRWPIARYRFDPVGLYVRIAFSIEDKRGRIIVSLATGRFWGQTNDGATKIDSDTTRYDDEKWFLELLNTINETPHLR